MLPYDVYTDRSTDENPQIDYRKVKNFCNDVSRPLTIRLELFDIVFNNNYTIKYTKLPTPLKEFILKIDLKDGFKTVRNTLSRWCK